MRSHTAKVGKVPNWLRALGPRELPAEIMAEGIRYELETTYKHDFFAATGLYRGNGSRVVAKFGRTAPAGIIPLRFVGKYLARREARLLKAAAGIAGIPRLVDTIAPTGIVREFVEGRPLGRKMEVSHEFFYLLETMLRSIHSRSMAYVDLEKPENILCGDDGRPYLIDFQISWKPRSTGPVQSPGRWFLRVLQQADRYHLMKHWRRLRPDQVDAESLKRWGRPPFWIRWHRMIFRPLTILRRWILVRLGARESTRGRSPG